MVNNLSPIDKVIHLDFTNILFTFAKVFLTFVTMNKRLQQFILAENISQSAFADRLGVARASVSHILAGRNKPGFDFIVSMSKSFPYLNLEWLITGEGKMYKRDSPAALDLFSPREEPQEPVIPMHVEEEQPKSAPIIETDSLDNVNKSAENQKTISKIIVFFSDGSFQELGG